MICELNFYNLPNANVHSAAQSDAIGPTRERTDRQTVERTDGFLTLRLTAIAIHFNEPGPIRSIGKGRSADKRISIMIQF